MLQVDPGREFMGSVTKEMESHKTYIRHWCTEIHRDQAIVERFNRTLANACLAISMLWKCFCLRVRVYCVGQKASQCCQRAQQ